MIYNDLVDIIGELPEGKEWIYGLVGAVVVSMYVYTFCKTIIALFGVTSK